MTESVCMSTSRLAPPSHTARRLLDRITGTLAANGLSSAAQVGLELGPETPALHITRWHYTHRLHDLWHLQIEASSPQPLPDAARLLWQTAVFWQRDGGTGFHQLTAACRPSSQRVRVPTCGTTG